MINSRALAVGALGLLLSAPLLDSQGRPRYRDFQLGGNLSSVSALTGVAVSEARAIHVRPARMQELQWQRPYSSSETLSQTDPVKQIVFSFYNDQLSKLVVDYDHERTAGLTDTDLIDALSIEYGPRLKPGARTGRSGVVTRVEEESGTPVARWAGADYSVVLYRGYTSDFRLIVASPRLEALARTADVQATRLDDREAPQREIARQKKETDDARASQAKSRVANKAAFRP
jgi:hypothetical protein